MNAWILITVAAGVLSGGRYLFPIHVSKATMTIAELVRKTLKY